MKNRVGEYIKVHFPSTYNTDLSSIPFAKLFFNDKLGCLCLGVQLPKTVNQAIIEYWRQQGFPFSKEIYKKEIFENLKNKSPLMFNTKNWIVYLPFSKIGIKSDAILKYFEPIFINDGDDLVVWYPTQITRNLMKDVFNVAKKLQDYDYWIGLLPKYKNEMLK